MKVKGIDRFVRKIKTLPDRTVREIKEVIRDTADAIVIDSADDAPVDFAFLKNSISNYATHGGLNYSIIVGANYAAYVEFGTGTEVEVPNEAKKYAEQFRGEGKRQVNLPARPFFFPNYFKHRDELIKNLERILKENMRR